MPVEPAVAAARPPWTGEDHVARRREALIAQLERLSADTRAWLAPRGLAPRDLRGLSEPFLRGIAPREPLRGLSRRGQWLGLTGAPPTAGATPVVMNGVSKLKAPGLQPPEVQDDLS